MRFIYIFKDCVLGPQVSFLYFILEGVAALVLEGIACVLSQQMMMMMVRLNLNA